MLHGHGDDAYRHGGDVRVNFSSNVPPWGWAAGLRECLNAELGRVETYPEVAAESLTAAIARKGGVAEGNVLVTAGATAGIYLIAQAFRGARSCVVVPTFAEYEDACVVNDHTMSFVAWGEFVARRAPEGIENVWVCNPNNPTGAVLTREFLLERVRQRRDVRFVVDVAYAELCEVPALTVRDSAMHPNLLVVHSLTKRFAIPGLRLGFVSGAEETLRRVRRFRQPWAVNSLALAAGEYLLRTEAEDDGWRAAYLAEARELFRGLGAIDGVCVEASASGFALVRLGRGTGAELKAWLLREYGFLVRDAGNFRGLDERCVRVSAQRPEENRALVAAIERWTRLH